MRIQIPLTPDLDDESYLQIEIKPDKEVVIQRLKLDHTKKEKDLQLIYREECKSDQYFGQYARICDRGKFIVYKRTLGELTVVDEETVEFELRHKLP